MGKEIDFTSQYLQTVEVKPDQIVSVTAPSGFVFQFLKPKKHFVLFRIGRIPQNATQAALKKWQTDGNVKTSDVEAKGASDDDMRAFFEIRDYVLDRSHLPKLVVGEALNPNELSTDNVSDDDLEFLMNFIAGGGEGAGVLDTFPGKPGANTLASANRKERRAAAKPTSRARK